MRGVFEPVAFFVQEWSDILLQWNEDDFGGVSEIRVPAHKIWRPDIILYN